eukprot:CAMPEP_0197664490 /NCGR_PEP_ID=MMETSP1338-20131121/58668_1 /TAXON_ID=43686 ORGANISM="Pelagodinium beii, Strain RCC1491" /NCGR_SAMPLE_ID=MMETSP1338 /ASSEMBLY_ACC=CAM_ASM_000754 /LENGTH=704 /DNA_ID=CAMNT_0043243145 /DNA_START=59 /DNA_END=2173 /DNA_ORIENTATION=-
MALLVLAMLAVPVASVKTVHTVKTLHTALSLDLSGDRPITKVVKLLKDMAAQSEADAAAEADVYEKFQCYCTKTIDEKTKSIETLTDTIAMTKIDIEKNVALASQLAEKKEKLERDLQGNEESQTAANSSRKKANEEFLSEETDMTNGLTQLSQAYDTLAAINPPDAAGQASLLLQFSENPALVSLNKQLQEAAQGQGFLSRAPGNYEGQTGGVLGVLRSTRDTYAKNLEDLRAAEAASVEAYDKLLTTLLASEDELEAMKAMTMSAQTDTATKLAALRKGLKADEETLATDEEIKASTEKMYAEKTAIMEERSRLRTQENTAIAQAVSVLNSDSAFDAFGKTETTKTQAEAFLQLSQESSNVKSIRTAVLSLLKSEIHKTHSARLAHLAAFMDATPKVYTSERPVNPFAPVLKEIDDMEGVIHAEEKADKKKFDFCVSERTTNHAANASRTDEINTLSSSITQLAQTATTKEGELQTAKFDLGNNTVDQTTVTADRKAENEEYQTNIANLQNAAMLMQKAIKILTTYYDKLQPKDSLLQKEEATQAEEPPSYEFSAKFQGQKGGGGTGVIGQLQTILNTTEEEESNAHSAEQQAQAEFEDQMKALTDNEATLKQSITDLTKLIADTRLSMDQKKDERTDAREEKASIIKYLEDIKPGCDFIEANYEQRKTNRIAESESLTKAITLIKGTPAYTNFEEKEAAAR